MKKKTTKKKVTRLKRAVRFCIVMGIAGTVWAGSANWYVKHESSKKIVTGDTAAGLSGIDCIMVLGCGLRADGQPTRMLADRLDEGIALYQAGVAPKLLMSGDHGREEYDEVNEMKRYAMEQGVPSEDIFMDHAGFSTYESMYRAREIFEVSRMVVVTQEYHLYRAVYNGNKNGIDTYGISARKVSYGGQRSRDIREVLARNKDFLICFYLPEPTYLGEAIPVSGNGDSTND